MHRPHQGQSARFPCCTSPKVQIVAHTCAGSDVVGPLGGLLALLARVLGLLALLGLPVQALMWSVHLAASLLFSALKLATLLSSALSAMPRRCVSICTFVLVKPGFALVFGLEACDALVVRVVFDRCVSVFVLLY